MASKLRKFFGLNKRTTTVATCLDEECSTSTPLKEKGQESTVDFNNSPTKMDPLSQGMVNQWTDKSIPSLGIPIEMWLYESPGSKMMGSVIQGNVNVFTSELTNLSKADMLTVDIAGEGLLHVVCRKKNISFLRMIMEKGFFLNSLNSFGMTPLHICVHLQWLEGVQVLLDFGASPEYLPEHICEEKGFVRESPIMTAARKGNQHMVEALLNKVCQCHEYSPNNNSVYHLASYSQNYCTLNYILQMKERFTNINELNNDSESPLHTLFKKKSELSSEDEIVNIVNLLLHNQVEINLQNNKGESPLYLAANSGLSNVVSVLLQYGANLCLRTNNNENVLHAACNSANSEVLKVFLTDRKLDNLINEPNTSGILPFHIAVRNSAVDCCKLLLKCGDHLTTTDSKGITLFSHIMTNMDNADELMETVLDNNISRSNNESHTNDTITFDFSYILSKTGSNDVQDSIISQFSDTRSEHLIMHPVIETFIYLKWRKIWLFFYFHLFMFFLFVLVHTYYIVIKYCVTFDIEVQKLISRAVYDIHIILLTFLFSLTIAYTLVDLRRYCKHFETYFNIGSLILSSIVVFSQYFSLSSDMFRRDIAAISVFLCWTEFMMLLGRDPSLNGTYVLMFTTIAQALMKLLVAFLALLIAFTLCFVVLFHDIKDGFFTDIPIAFVKILMMMIGEIEYSDFFTFLQGQHLRTRIIANIFLVAFIFLVTILLASLLISLAVNDLPDLQRKGKIRKLVKQSSYLLSYEKIATIFGCIQRSKKVNPLRFMIGLCTIDRQITINVLDKSSRIPMPIIKAAKQILVNQKSQITKHKQQEDMFADLSLLKYTCAKDLERLEEKFDKLSGIMTKMHSTNKIVYSKV